MNWATDGDVVALLVSEFIEAPSSVGEVSDDVDG